MTNENKRDMLEIGELDQVNGGVAEMTKIPDHLKEKMTVGKRTTGKTTGTTMKPNSAMTRKFRLLCQSERTRKA